ncbi:ribose 5-phosphate isomerase B [Pedobacter sp. UYEF25]
MKLAIGSDHAGFDCKTSLINHLIGYEIEDFGPFNSTSVDYPDFAHAVAEAVASGKFDYGVLLCGSANGVAITANKHQSIRAGICWLPEIASLIRKHNNANILCIPARFVSLPDAKEITTVFLNTVFEGGRHQKRIDKILL